MNKYSRVKAEIDLGAISSNIEELHKNLPEGTQVMGIIKADGYGHGCVSIGRVLEKIPYIWGYGVATADEALELKAVPLHKPILILGCVFPDQYEQMIMNDVRFNIYNIEMAVKINECAKKLGKKALAHIKIDTGMSRLGFSCRRESVDEIEEERRLLYVGVTRSSNNLYIYVPEEIKDKKVKPSRFIEMKGINDGTKRYQKRNRCS